MALESRDTVIWRIDVPVGSWLHACGPATENVLEPTDDDTFNSVHQSAGHFVDMYSGY